MVERHNRYAFLLGKNGNNSASLDGYGQEFVSDVVLQYGAAKDQPKAVAGRMLNGANVPTTRRPLRVALYSHDTMGVGHMRRNLLIAQTLSDQPCDATVLMIAGAREASVFATPAGVDCVTLPSLSKSLSGDYRSRKMQMELSDLIQLRAETISAALHSYRPDLFIVDKVPRGVFGELVDVLPQLRIACGTRCVLGLREILDSPATVAREWREHRCDEAIRDFYDAIWVYGDAGIFNTVDEYGLSGEVARKVRFTGYLDQRRRLQYVDDSYEELAQKLKLPRGPFALCVVGGGQDGAELAAAFLQAPMPPGWSGVLLMGPCMPPAIRQELRRRSAVLPGFTAIDSVDEADTLVDRAECVIAMGGYNTVCSVLSFQKRALIVPRTHPRQEQLIRAQRLAHHSLVDVILPEQLTPSEIAGWLHRQNNAAGHPTPSDRYPVDLKGLVRIPELVAELIPATAAVPGV